MLSGSASSPHSSVIFGGLSGEFLGAAGEAAAVGVGGSGAEGGEAVEPGGGEGEERGAI